jgi:hypothetical protein
VQWKEDEVSQAPKDVVNHETRASANQVASAMILDITKFRIKNNTTVMISDLPCRHNLHGQIKNKRNIRDMKRVREKSVLSSNRKRGSIDGMNSAMLVRST